MVGPVKIAVIGECMVELATPANESCRLGFGGDTLNTAVYMARLGVQVSYITALSDDPFSDEMLNAWQAEGIDTALVKRLPGRVPGLYAIRTDASGERRFFYWRDQAPAKDMLKGDTDWLADVLGAFDGLYFSGITLSILDEQSRETLLRLLATAKATGTRIAFDPNYRPAGWPDADRARHWFAKAYALADFALPTLDDEQALDASLDAEALCARLPSPEVIVKRGSVGCLIRHDEGTDQIPVPMTVAPKDTTAAGDSFNAAYLAARFQGSAPKDAALSAHRLAATVIQHSGAIIPLNAMPKTEPIKL